jgi:uncharacterized membrane protein YfcA
MTLHIAVVTALTFFICGVLQGMVGFAFALFALPALLALGFSLPDSVALVLMGALSQMFLAIHLMRRSIDWKGLTPLIIVGTLATPIGIFFMHRLSVQTGMIIRQCLGGVILATVVAQWLLRPVPQERVAAGWGYLAALTSGILGGLFGIGGPPNLIWVYAHRWSNEKYRITPVALALPRLSLQVAMMLWVFGWGLLSVFETGMIFAPFSILGSAAGLKIGSRLPIPWLRTAVFALLCMIGAVNLLRPWLGL